MNNQAQMIGMLIKKYRLEQNMSQESLCKGICAISYLSKIENGSVTCGEDILKQLMQTLGIELMTDPEDLATIETDIKSFFTYFFLYNNKGMARIHQALKELDLQLIHSPLAIDYMLVKAFYAHFLAYGNSKEREALRTEIYTLLKYESYMSLPQIHLTYYLIGHFEMMQESNFATAKAYFEKASRIKSDGVVLEALSSVNYTLGNYSEAIRLGDLAYTSLMNQGYSERATHLCFVIAASYANGRDIENMLVYYNRLLALNKHDENHHQIGAVHYNIGSAYLAVRNFKKARTHLEQSYAFYKNDDEDAKSKFLMVQKLTLAIYGENKLEESKIYLKELVDLYERIKNERPEPSLKMSLEWIQCLCETENPIASDSYLTLLRKLYNQACKDSHHGFKTFYGDYLIEALKAQRKYKEALEVTEALFAKWKVSQKSHWELL